MWSPLSKRRQKAEKGVVGLEAMGILAGWRHLCEHLLFRREIRFDISMRRLDALVTEPQRDNGDVYPRLKQVHGRGMSIIQRSE